MNIIQGELQLNAYFCFSFILGTVSYRLISRRTSNILTYTSIFASYDDLQTDNGQEIFCIYFIVNRLNDPILTLFINGAPFDIGYSQSMEQCAPLSTNQPVKVNYSAANMYY